MIAVNDALTRPCCDFNVHLAWRTASALPTKSMSLFTKGEIAVILYRCPLLSGGQGRQSA